MSGRKIPHIRRSTMILSICFVAVFALWIAVRPSEAATPTRRTADVTDLAPRHRGGHHSGTAPQTPPPPQAPAAVAPPTVPTALPDSPTATYPTSATTEPTAHPNAKHSPATPTPAPHGLVPGF